MKKMMMIGMAWFGINTVALHATPILDSLTTADYDPVLVDMNDTLVAALNLGGGGNVTVNGVPFAGTSLTTVTAGGVTFTLFSEDAGGAPTAAGNSTTGGTDLFANHVYSNGSGNGLLGLSGLTDGLEYRLQDIPPFSG